MIRAAVLAVRMSLAAIDPVDALRFLRVPAIVWVMRKRAIGRWCGERHVRRRRGR